MVQDLGQDLMMRIHRFSALIAVLVVVGASCGRAENSNTVAIPGVSPTSAPIIPITAPPESTDAAVDPVTTTTITSTTTEVAAPDTTAAPAPATTLEAETPVTTTSPATTAPPTTAPPPTTEPPPLYSPEPTEGPLREGDEGPRSADVQRDLIALGFLPAGFDDGQYGVTTVAAVRAFQTENELDPDGVAGPITVAALKEAVAALALEA